MTNKSDTPRASSTGQIFTEGSYLDSHFQACQPEYEARLKSVGLEAGWHVLDAGSGSGCFLPLMSQQLGPSGRIQALDLAPENVELVEKMQSQNAFDCSIMDRVESARPAL